MTNYIELEEKELMEVGAGGLLGGIVGGVVGGLVGVPVGMIAYTTGRLTGHASTDDFDNIMKDSMMASAGLGATLGAFTPTP